jgi:hypothetical protein
MRHKIYVTDFWSNIYVEDRENRADSLRWSNQLHNLWMKRFIRNPKFIHRNPQKSTPLNSNELEKNIYEEEEMIRKRKNEKGIECI